MKLKKTMAEVIALSKSPKHSFNKYNCQEITLLENPGVEGDAHMGTTVKHRSRVAKDPSQPNLRQVHLIHSELFDELRNKGFDVSPGQMGENITTKGIDLLSLPKDTILKVGQNAQIKITGLRNPCTQINSIKEGLMNAVLDKDPDGKLIRRAGIMGIILCEGIVRKGVQIEIELPKKPYISLDKV